MRNLFQNKPDFVPENRVQASYWTWRSTSKMAMRSAWSPVLSLLTCLLPTTRSTTDASSARCWRWLATYTWPTWYAPCWKTDASSWCWTGRPLATTTKWTTTGKCIGTDVVQHLHQRPARTRRHSQLHLCRRLVHRVARKLLQQHRSVTHVCPEQYDHLIRH